MGSDTLLGRTNGQTIDQTWFNTVRSALNLDFIPRASTGIVTDQAGSLGSSTLRWTNAYLMSQYLMNGSRYSRFLRASGGSDHTLTWPNALPGTGETRPLQVNDSGIITFAPIPTEGIADSAVTRQKIEDINYFGTASSGNFTTTSTSLTDVTNLSVSITTTGRPIQLVLLGFVGTTSRVQVQATGTAIGFISFVRDANVLQEAELQAETELFIPPGTVNHIDLIGAGTYTYKVQVKVSAGTTFGVFNCRLVVYEII